MRKHGLSGTARLGLTGTGNSAYREPKSPAKPQKSSTFWPLNNANRESYGFFLTAARHALPVPGTVATIGSRSIAP